MCSSDLPLVTSCGNNINYGGLVPLDIPAESDGPLPTVAVSEPTLDSAGSGSSRWSATAWFANDSARTIEFDQVPTLVLLPPNSHHLADQCTQQSQEWTVNGDGVDEVRSLASGENAYLAITAVCSHVPAAAVPDGLVQWGSSKDRAALFQVIPVP